MRLTDTQQRVLDAYRKDPRSTLDEVAAHLAVTKSAVRHAVEQLCLKGLLRHTAYVPRSVEVVGEQRPVPRWPEPKEPLTPIQQAILDCYRRNERARLEDVGRRVGRSKTTVFWHVRSLVKLGLMRNRGAAFEPVRLDNADRRIV